MKILAFDSTAKVASVAVSDNEKILASYSIDNGLTQSELLLPMAEDMLRSLKLDFDDIDIFATSVGPGSFTGVRIGVSLVKGLAFGKNKPCAAVSTLEALAENLMPLDGVLVPLMDARRQQVYTAIFLSDGESVRRECEDTAISITELAKKLATYRDKKIYLSGDGYSVARPMLSELGIKVEKTPDALINQSAASVARLAYKRFLIGEYTTDTEISPTYLRLPQAERERLMREGKM